MSTSEYLRIGKVLGVHGLHGRLKVLIITDIDERFSPGNKVYLPEGDGYVLYTVEEFAGHKGRVGLIRLSGISGRDEAARLKGREVFIEKATAEVTRGSLESGSFYYYDIIGCRVYRDGKEFGEVTDIIEAGSGNVLVIKGPGDDEFMVPFINSMVDTSAISQNRIDIYPVEGLLD